MGMEIVRWTLFVVYMFWWLPLALFPIRKKIGGWLYDLWWEPVRYIARLINAPKEAALIRMVNETEAAYAAIKARQLAKPAYESMLLNAGYETKLRCDPLP